MHKFLKGPITIYTAVYMFYRSVHGTDNIIKQSFISSCSCPK